MNQLLKNLKKGFTVGFDEALDTRKPFFKKGDIPDQSEVQMVLPIDGIDQPADFTNPWVRTGYAGGRIAGDWSSDATRNPWWRYNAAQAQSNELGQALGRRAGLSNRDALIAGMGLTTVMELASGNIDLRNLGEAGRPKGYQSLFPKTTEQVNPETGELEVITDYRKSNNPLAELGARYFLGRTGRLLPDNQLLEERPGLTPEEVSRFRQAQRRNTLFGWENLPREATTVGGAALGAGLSFLTKKPISTIAGSTVAGNLVPTTANVVSELGIVQGTRDSLDDPIGEIEVLGYRLPLLRGIGGTAAVAGAGYGALKLHRAGATKPVIDALRGIGKVS
jgi:hypothetical protein